ncbi:MarR family winged helix-turn-helix transcriptional regulator [Leptothoe spongobia]|uniref:MarR family transcriptional regulator n=1 Tax=Leptothoe spongobia TAU-MAC 1115 TaxID=1967444 RepID=A0A947DHB8_9CYAN|nr:MarR family transcriptional regulator [Leptothoe spongobia]MBT9317137.1 MarR family transcriptional regulator [Leptothoe spongobia TAU-MAC 1115]
MSNSPDLQGQLIALIRAFGLHRPDQTPCGQPVTVAEAHALMELSNGQSLSQNELSTRLSLEKSTVSRLVKILERREWLQRNRSEADRRVMQLALTKNGQQVAEQLATARREKFDRILSAIPNGQQTVVLNSLKILVEAIHKSE